jgi:hypothetical protein
MFVRFSKNLAISGALDLQVAGHATGKPGPSDLENYTRNQVTFRLEYDFFASGARQPLALYATCGMRRVIVLRWGCSWTYTPIGKIGLPALILVVLASLIVVGTINHAMGRPFICTCGYVKLFYGGLDDPEVSQHFIDWYTFSHVGHGIALNVFIRAFAERGPSTSLPSITFGVLISVGVAGVWEVMKTRR